MCTNLCSGGISGHTNVIENTEKQGQCSRCLTAVYPGHLCGVEEGRLVCGAQVRASNLEPYTYGTEILKLLEEYNIEPECA
jgi:hypothetical protein